MAELTSKVFLVLEATESRGRNTETGRYDRTSAFTVREMRKNKPNLSAGQVAIQLELNVDSSLFDEYIPKLVATIEGSSVIVEPEVVVVNQIEANRA